MITEAILSVFLYPISLLILGLDFVLPTISIPAGVFDGLGTLIGFAAFFLPLGSILPIFLIRFGLTNFDLIWKVVLRLKSFIPTMGG